MYSYTKIIIKKIIPKRDVRLMLLGLFLSLILGYLPAKYTPLAAWLETYMPYKWLLTLFLSLLIALCLIVPYTISLIKKLPKTININDYEFIKDPGYYKHKIKGGEFCHPCLVSSPPIVSPLTEPNEGVLVCNKCNKTIFTKEAKESHYKNIKDSNEAMKDRDSLHFDDIP